MYGGIGSGERAGNVFQVMQKGVGVWLVPDRAK